jgi:hypothetical protein
VERERAVEIAADGMLVGPGFLSYRSVLGIPSLFHMYLAKSHFALLLCRHQHRHNFDPLAFQGKAGKLTDAVNSVPRDISAPHQKMGTPATDVTMGMDQTNQMMVTLSRSSLKCSYVGRARNCDPRIVRNQFYMISDICASLKQSRSPTRICARKRPSFGENRSRADRFQLRPRCHMRLSGL